MTASETPTFESVLREQLRTRGLSLATKAAATVANSAEGKRCSAQIDILGKLASRIEGLQSSYLHAVEQVFVQVPSAPEAVTSALKTTGHTIAEFDHEHRMLLESQSPPMAYLRSKERYDQEILEIAHRMTDNGDDKLSDEVLSSFIDESKKRLSVEIGPELRAELEGKLLVLAKHTINASLDKILGDNNLSNATAMTIVRREIIGDLMQAKQEAPQSVRLQVHAFEEAIMSGLNKAAGVHPRIVHHS